MMFVFTMPGHTSVTPTAAPLSRRSARRPFESPTIACLVAEYGLCTGALIKPPTDDTFTTCPSPARRMCGRNTWIPYTGPHRFTPTTHSQSRGAISHA